MAVDRTKIINKVKSPSSNTSYDIVPTKITDADSNYSASLPALTKDETLATLSDLPVGEYYMNINDNTTTSTEDSLENIVVGNSTDGFTRYANPAQQIYWNSTHAYTANQCCWYNYMMYVCIANASAGTLPTNTTYFKPLIVS